MKRAVAKKKPATSTGTTTKKPATTDAPKAVRMSPAEYAWAAQNAMLQDDSDEVRDGPDHRVYLLRGREFAVLTRKNGEIILDFEPPTDMSRFEEVKRFYTATPRRRGWLRFRAPANHDPRPYVEADLGEILCAAEYERNPPPK